MTFGRFQRIFRGLARTQIPTNKNCAPELPTFGVIAGVSYPEVQWNSLALGELPWWSQLTPTPGKYAYHLSFSDLHGRLANTSLLNRLHFLLLLPPKSWCCRVFGLKIILLRGRVKNWAHNLWDWGQLFYLKKDLTVQHSPCLPCEAPWCLPSALVLCRLDLVQGLPLASAVCLPFVLDCFDWLDWLDYGEVSRSWRYCNTRPTRERPEASFWQSFPLEKSD